MPCAAHAGRGAGVRQESMPLPRRATAPAPAADACGPVGHVGQATRTTPSIPPPSHPTPPFPPPPPNTQRHAHAHAHAHHRRPHHHHPRHLQVDPGIHTPGLGVDACQALPVPDVCQDAAVHPLHLVQERDGRAPVGDGDLAQQGQVAGVDPGQHVRRVADDQRGAVVGGTPAVAQRRVHQTGLAQHGPLVDPGPWRLPRHLVQPFMRWGPGRGGRDMSSVRCAVRGGGRGGRETTCQAVPWPDTTHPPHNQERTQE